jgi:hypothetical protein
LITSVFVVPSFEMPDVVLLQLIEEGLFVFCWRTKLLAVEGHDTATVLEPVRRIVRDGRVRLEEYLIVT